MKNLIRWVIHHKTASHIFIYILLIGGITTFYFLPKDILPDRKRNTVSIKVSYPGSTSDDIERLIVLPIENGLNNIDGIRSLRSNLYNGGANVIVELDHKLDPYALHNQIQGRIANIHSFPEGMKPPLVRLDDRTEATLKLIVYGDATLASVQRATIQVYDRLIQIPELKNIRAVISPEFIDVQLQTDKILSLNLSLQEVVAQIRNYAVIQPVGEVEIDHESFRIAVESNSRTQDDISNIPILLGNHYRSSVLLKDIANISEKVDETEYRVLFNGKSASIIYVFRTAPYSPIDISEAVITQLKEIQTSLPEGIDIAIAKDNATNYKLVFNSLVLSLIIAIFLVFICLAMFLDYRLAFWVAFGVALSLVGSMLFFPMFDLSINMMSLNAIILTIGMLVDDAIVVGESIFYQMDKGSQPKIASLDGVCTVVSPITFSVLTTIVSFFPLLFLDPQMAFLFDFVPWIVFICLTLSWVDSIFLLPKHLSLIRFQDKTNLGLQFDKVRIPVNNSLNKFLNGPYQIILSLICNNPTKTVILGMVFIFVSLGIILSNPQNKLRFWPSEDGTKFGRDFIFEDKASTQDIFDQEKEIRALAMESFHKIGAEKEIISIESDINDHELYMKFRLTPIESRNITKQEIKAAALNAIKRSPARDNLWVFGSRKDIETDDDEILLELLGRNGESINQAAMALHSMLDAIESIESISTLVDKGTHQKKIHVSKTGARLGLDNQTLSNQLHTIFTGKVAFTINKYHGESEVRVRLGEYQQLSNQGFMSLPIQVGDGSYTSLGEVAEITESIVPGKVTRLDGMRSVSLFIQLSDASQMAPIIELIQNTISPALAQSHPEVSLRFSGTEKEIAESLLILKVSSIVTAVVIFLMLCVPLQSMRLAALVLSVIPFCLIGALCGHAIFGLEVTIISLIGLIAISGVAINDGLLLVSTAKDIQKQGERFIDSIMTATTKRFRPLFLTTITTFLGVFPLMFNTNVEAARMAPLAISVGFGVLGATLSVLLVLPAIYLLINPKN